LLLLLLKRAFKTFLTLYFVAGVVAVSAALVVFENLDFKPTIKIHAIVVVAVAAVAAVVADLVCCS